MENKDDALAAYARDPRQYRRVLQEPEEEVVEQKSEEKPKQKHQRK